MIRIIGASPQRPAGSPLGWLPPRLHRVFRAAGRTVFVALPLAGLAGGPPAAASTPPGAQYHATLQDGRVGDIFEVVVTVHWPGAAQAYDVPPPHPVPDSGIVFALRQTTTDHDARGSRVEFRWQVTAREPGTYAMADLLPVVAYSAESPTPFAVPAELPAHVTIVRPRSWATRAAGVAGAGLGAGAATLAVMTWTRRRAQRREAQEHAEARTADAQAHDERFARAQEQRVNGDYAAYCKTMRALARDVDAPAEVLRELDTLHERVVFGGHQPAPHELERAASLVRRLLKGSPTREDTHDS